VSLDGGDERAQDTKLTVTARRILMMTLTAQGDDTIKLLVRDITVEGFP